MKYFYFFGEGHAEGNADMKAELGGKGANLAEMTNLGLPVPAGFTISTKCCLEFLKNKKYPENFDKDLKEYLSKLEQTTGKKFGDGDNPLLVSIRSGAKFSMPGMMDTILNLGLNDHTVKGVIKNTNDERFAYDSYRRFITMFGNVVMGISHDYFEEVLEEKKEDTKVKLDTELSVKSLKELVIQFKEIVKKTTGENFPEDPQDQLLKAIEAVFSSWNNNRAITYRKINDIPHNLGTAVNVQSMVFGNMGDDSGTGVAFTRNPSTGEKMFFGEYLINAQGEDVVAGIRTPEPIATLDKKNPVIYKQLIDVKEKLEKHYRDMQDLEFTIEKGKLFMLQTRNGKRTAKAALKIAVDLVAEKLITKEEALMRIEAKSLNQLLHPSIDPKAKRIIVVKGLPASTGAASGKVVFSPDDAETMHNDGEKVILVRRETSPEDIHGMHASEGILTATGGMTSHAAVVARGMGKPCVAGASEMIIDKKHRKIIIGKTEIAEGEVITIDGSVGEVMIGEMPMVKPGLTGDFETIMKWSDEVRKMKVFTNADTPIDSKVARDFGAEGIGLCRTEHMFFEDDRIPFVRQMILAQNVEERKKYLEKLLPMQRTDFVEIFKVMNALPVTIRLLDPPLHEFLPQTDKKIQALADDMGIPFETLKNTVERLHEVNPMLGHRGCRLAITYPEIYEMQVRAILEAGAIASRDGIKVIAKIEIPLVVHTNEIKVLKEMVDKIAKEMIEKDKNSYKNFEYNVGTMIELPRACLVADKIAPYTDFFSFGTNDLTQTVYGLSRDDAGKFLPQYIEKNIMEHDPTEKLDEIGVGRLMEIAIELGRKVKPNLEIGICGEHGGDPDSIMISQKLGLDLVSCSPYRVPIARLAAAQATIKCKNSVHNS
ncbi:MAG: pyruvate phosphate dikinase, pyruvate,orthophosphate dikinase [Candidatus Peregrinibacteria bacterium GW2011_GWF2_33_10]|nr:MAG: pyruvate phosphate dikinase, pyruvate,orthophosphate dikinase [Candidatus Peregrinibacteria bacterium GW2011_GWF2_33_10]